MKTGRLLKFRRPGGEVHVYLYTLQTLSGPLESAVEQDVRAWVDAHYPIAR